MEPTLIALVDFAAQAYTGVQISLFRSCGLEYNRMGPKSSRVREACLGQYLNTCWKNLILKDDPFVINIFNAIHNQLPNELPLCLIKVVYETGLLIFENPPEIGFSSKLSKRNPQNQAYVETLRQMLYQIYRDECVERFSKIFLDKDHKCVESEPSFDSLPQSDPNFRIFTYPPDFLEFLYTTS